MEYIESNVCYVLDTKGVKVGAKGYFADSPYGLKERVSREEQSYFGTLTCIKSEDKPDRFVKNGASSWSLFYPVYDIEDMPLTMGKVSELCGKASIADTCTLLACCADKIVEATNLYTKCVYDLNVEHSTENKKEFTRALVDLLCHCGKIIYHEDINIDKALTARLFNNHQEVKVEEN